MAIKQRDYSIDNIRGIAILMVVLGHSIIIYSSEWNIYSTSIQAPLLDFLKRIINLIQMPLFFSLSGYLFLHSLEKRGKIVDLVFIRVKRLLLPYMVFCIFWLLPIRLIIKYPGYSNYSLSYVIWNRVLLGYDNGHMWYLPTLFLCFLFSLFAYKMLALCKFVGGGYRYYLPPAWCIVIFPWHCVKFAVLYWIFM